MLASTRRGSAPGADGAALSPESGQRLASALGIALIVVLAVWRVRCIGDGPDPDTDAYGHFVIARQFLDTPLDIYIHWVWLPLYHVLLAAGIALGATLDSVRYANALLSALTPLLLWSALRRRPGEAQQEPWLPAAAACMAAAVPLAVAMGTTGQPETCFTLLLLATVVLLREERRGAAALLLGLLVLLRYEAWAVAAVVALVLGVQRLRGERLGVGGVACILAGPCSVGAWAALRRLGGAPWFDFLGQNQRFAETARAQLALPAGVPWSEITRVIELAPLVLWLLCGACLLGLLPLWRRAGVWFVLPPLAIAAFLGLGWLTRSHLGLSRHWVALVPFAATAAAYGLAECARALRRRLVDEATYVFPVLALSVVALELRASAPLLHEWREQTGAALPDRRDAGRFLRGLPGNLLILCDDAAAEVLSELPRSRFVRSYLGGDALREVKKWAGPRELVVFSAAARIRSLQRFGHVVYGDPAREGLLGVQIDADPRRVEPQP